MFWKFTALPMFASALIAPAMMAQATFDVASIRPSSARVENERNGTVEAAFGTLKMHDVTVVTCIHWAYSMPLPLIHGPSSLKDIHYDITAKTDPEATEEQMRLMLRTLLIERFKLAFHREKAELRIYALTVAKGGVKMHSSALGSKMSRENSGTGMTGRSMTMRELSDYLSDPLDAPLTDNTALPGRYDFVIDFTPYVDMERINERPDPAAVLKYALKGELGLDLVMRKAPMDIMVVDHVEPPSKN